MEYHYIREGKTESNREVIVIDTLVEKKRKKVGGCISSVRLLRLQLKHEGPPVAARSWQIEPPY